MAICTPKSYTFTAKLSNQLYIHEKVIKGGTNIKIGFLSITKTTFKGTKKSAFTGDSYIDEASNYKPNVPEEDLFEIYPTLTFADIKNMIEFTIDNKPVYDKVRFNYFFYKNYFILSIALKPDSGIELG